MILVDTSVLIHHLRRGDEALAAALDSNEVLMHPFVMGELACGNLGDQREEIRHLLADLPRAIVATDEEVLGFIDRRTLMGCGIGYVDAHLLASVTLTEGARLWARDKRLAHVAANLRLPLQKL